MKDDPNRATAVGFFVKLVWKETPECVYFRHVSIKDSMSSSTTEKKKKLFQINGYLYKIDVIYLN